MSCNQVLSKLVTFVFQSYESEHLLNLKGATDVKGAAAELRLVNAGTIRHAL